MRPSSLANRTSSSVNAQATLLKLAEKKKEFEAVAALETASNNYLDRINGLANDCDIMALAGEVHGQVSEQWPRMFHILNLFLASRESQDQSNHPLKEGEMLVRIPIEDPDTNTAAISSR